MEEPFIPEHTREYVKGAMRRYYARKRARGLALLREWQAKLSTCTHPSSSLVTTPDSEGRGGVVIDEMVEERCDNCRVLIGVSA